MSAFSTSCNRRAEDVRVLPVIIAKLELRDVQRQILFADLVKAANDAAFDDRPEAFDCLGVNRADNILLFGMVNDRVGIVFAEVLITDPLIGAEQRNFCATRLRARMLQACWRGRS